MTAVAKEMPSYDAITPHRPPCYSEAARNGEDDDVHAHGHGRVDRIAHDPGALPGHRAAAAATTPTAAPNRGAGAAEDSDLPAGVHPHGLPAGAGLPAKLHDAMQLIAEVASCPTT